MGKKKAASAASVSPKLTEGERELLSQMEEGYQLETDSLSSNPVLRRLKDVRLTVHDWGPFAYSSQYFYCGDWSGMELGGRPVCCLRAEIHWPPPSKQVDKFTNVAPNRYMRVVENGGIHPDQR